MALSGVLMRDMVLGCEVVKTAMPTVGEQAELIYHSHGKSSSAHVSDRKRGMTRLVSWLVSAVVRLSIFSVDPSGQE